jgi:hypothetical protein
MAALENGGDGGDDASAQAGEAVFYNARVALPIGLRDIWTRLKVGYYRSIDGYR